MIRFYFSFFNLLCSLTLLAQQANDDCTGAIALPDEIEYCSGPAAFSNVGATASFEQNDYPVCFDERDQIVDVWFSFIARRNAANVTVTGATRTSPGGTIRAPQFSIYDGGCSTAGDAQIGCRSPFEDANTGVILNGGNIIQTDLVVGQTYFILVGARNGGQGTFELCVNQFDNIPAPSSDCATGVILCDKSPFAVELLQGTGQVRDDLLSDNIDCQSEPQEFNSAWYKWTCDQSGSLTFVIDPLGADFNEDIDFVVYELTNGLDDCSGRTVLRQMFSGETSGAGDDNIPCFNETGLSSSDNDLSENCGCQPGNNNFVSAIEMISGRSYAVVIMNFSGSGDGFDIEFGGSGTFVGPEAEFTVNNAEVCVGDPLIFEDRSTSLDPISSREWDFGPTATPRIASGPGPHSVVFGSPGEPFVQLVIETERDCREVANQQEIRVICCDGQFAGSAMITDQTCPSDLSGAIDLTATSTFSPTTLTYAWSNDADTEDIDMLDVGEYMVTVGDGSGCTDVFTYTVDGPPAFTFDTLITMPSCGGAADGAFEFTVTGGGEGPYRYSLNGSPFGNDNRIDAIGVSTVNVRIRDANDCEVEQDIDVEELELGLVRGIEVFTEPVCADEATGQINIQIANGQPAYQYDFGLGDGFQNSNIRNGLVAGSYTVTARDATGCFGIFDIEITEPPVIELGLTGTGSTCFETDDGTLNVTASGGRPDYTFSWSDGQFTDSTSRSDLVPGTYTVSLTDDNGCLRTESLTLTQPNEIFPILVATNDLECFGLPIGSFELDATGGTPDYTYSSDGINFQQDSLLANLLAGDYTLYVQDANGCTDSLTGSLTEPREFIIDPGDERTITLGFDTIVRAVSNYTPVRYVWPPDSLPCLDPLCTRVRAQPVVTTDYIVVGINDAGCTDTATFKINVIDDKPLYIPNGFSPNGDGVNDRFTIYGGPAVASVEALRIYNRWGGLVFEREDFLANEPSLGWDGIVNDKEANSAVFVYYTSVRFINGDVVELSGDLTLVR